MAAQDGHTEIVRLLLGHGASVDAGGYRWCYSTGIAAKNGHLEIVRLLLEMGADPDLKTNEGVTALWAAGWKGHHQVVDLLAQRGADVNAARTTDGMTPLWRAAWKARSMLPEACSRRRRRQCQGEQRSDSRDDSQPARPYERSQAPQREVREVQSGESY